MSILLLSKLDAIGLGGRKSYYLILIAKSRLK